MVLGSFRYIGDTMGYDRWQYVSEDHGRVKVPVYFEQEFVQSLLTFLGGILALTVAWSAFSLERNKD
jgi:hypothetical protein